MEPVIGVIVLLVFAAAALIVFLPLQPAPEAVEERPPLITQPYEAGRTWEQPTPYFAAPVPESPDPLEIASNLDKKAMLATAMFFGVTVMLGGYFAFSDRLLRGAAERHLREVIGEQMPPRVDEKDPAGRRGASIYASLCFDCHGERGQGLVGLPLNRQDSKYRATCDFFGDQAKDAQGNALRPDKACAKGTQPGIPQGAEDQKTWDFLLKTVSRGRERPAPAISMPAWSREEGGPLNPEQIRQIVTFIMYGNWDLALRVREEEADELRAQANREEDPAKREELLKQAEGRTKPHPPAPPVALSPEDRAKAAIQTSCVACHAIQKGQASPLAQAPNLGAYAAEGPFSDQLRSLKASDPKWLEKWITNAPSIKPGTAMPPWQGILSEQQIADVAAYLLTLK